MSLAPQLPKPWLIHSIGYSEYINDRDEYGNDLFKPMVVIHNVRYDDLSSFSRNIQTDELSYTGVIFVDAVHSTNLPTEFKEQSRLNFRGKQLTIVKVINCYHPTADKVRHYELEVV